MKRRSESVIGQALNWTTPCWVTVAGGALALIGIGLFQLDLDWAAVGVLTLSFLTDWWDGALARFQQSDEPVMSREREEELSVWKRMNHRGVTNMGRALDPVVDKIRFIGLLWTVGLERVDKGIVFAITLLALALTLVRPVKRWLKLDTGGANQWGKYKVYAEVVFIVILVFGTRPLYWGDNPLATLKMMPILIDLAGTAAMFLACASLYKHIENGYTHYMCTRS